MKRKLVLGLSLSAVAALTLMAVACSSPAAAPTAAPTKAAAPAATTAPAAPAATKAPEATKPAAPAATTAPAAAAWPVKGQSITMIVPFGAGGSTDIGARLIAPGMEKALGVPVNVVNKPGAGSQTGLTEIAKAKTDGYTIGFSNLPNSSLIMADPERKAAFGPKDFQFLGAQVMDPSAIGIPANSPYKTMKDMVDAAKAKPETIKFGSDGPMTDDHLGIFLLEKASGAKFASVGFDGAAANIAALLGGHIDASFGHVGDFVATSKDGKVRVLAVADKERSPYFKDTATLTEMGYPVSNSSTRTIVVPAGTPKAAVDALSKAMKTAWDDAEHKKRMEDAGLTLRWMDGAATQAYSDEMDKLAKDLVAQVRGTTKP